MKNLFLLTLTILYFGFAATAQDNAVDFGDGYHNFGEIPQKVPAKHDFTFTNNSDKPIIIENVKAACGCTTPKWTKEAILPGEEGFVSAEYNAYNLGTFDKTITIHYTIGSERFSKTLHIKGKVVNKKG